MNGLLASAVSVVCRVGGDAGLAIGQKLIDAITDLWAPQPIKVTGGSWWSEHEGDPDYELRLDAERCSVAASELAAHVHEYLDAHPGGGWGDAPTDVTHAPQRSSAPPEDPVPEEVSTPSLPDTSSGLQTCTECGAIKGGR